MADKVLTAPATHAQPSRKGKKAWRKNVDISEVQEGLDVVRDEIIKGGIIAERAADELYAFDIAGDADIERKQKSRKVLKVDEILAQRSAVPGLPGRKRKIEAQVLPSGKKARNGTYVSHKQLMRLRAVADNANGGVVVEQGASYDPWIEQAPIHDPSLDFLEPPKAKREPKTLKQAPTPLTASKKPVSHVVKPDAGKSYNPLLGDWSALLQREGEAAVEAEKLRLAKEAAQAEREAQAEAEAAKVEAAEKNEYATDYESAWESEWDGIQSEGEKEVHTVKRPKRKTPAERNKVNARKERERLERHERKQKLRDAQEKRIREIAREVSARDKLQRPGTLANQPVSSDSDLEVDGQVILQRRRFGKLQVPDAPLEVTLPEDLQDSLRRLKPEGNLLTDRYRNLLINGKLEVRKKVGQVKKKQTYRSEKWGYKDWKLR